MRGVFRTHQNLRPIALTELFNGAIFCAATFAIIFFVGNRDLGLYSIAHASLWTDVISVSILLAITLRILKPRIALDQLWGMIKQAWPFTIYNLFYMIYFQVDQIIISLILTSAAVGVYSAPVQIVTVLLFIPIMVFQVTTPLMYKFATDDMPKYARVHRILWRYLSAFGVPAGVGLALLAEPILTLVYGQRYFAHDPALLHQAVQIMQVFGIFLAVRFVGIGHGNSLTTSDRQALRAKMQAVSVLFNIALDIIFIILWGPLGAALATLLTEIGITLTTMIIASKHVKESTWHIIRGLAPIAAATAIMALVLTLISAAVSVMVLVIFGISVYLAALWAFRFFTPKDRQLMTEIFSSRKRMKQTPPTP
jgi:O-antigen/teichoic acid export membrane protein